MPIRRSPRRSRRSIRLRVAATAAAPQARRGRVRRVGVGGAQCGRGALAAAAADAGAGGAGAGRRAGPAPDAAAAHRRRPARACPSRRSAMTLPVDGLVRYDDGSRRFLSSGPRRIARWPSACPSKIFFSGLRRNIELESVSNAEVSCPFEL